MQAIWNDKILAASEGMVVVESNHYFPASSLRREHFLPADTRSHCAWKGEARYCSPSVDGRRNRDVAGFYPAPTVAAMQIKDHIAFWKGVSAPA